MNAVLVFLCGISFFFSCNATDPCDEEVAQLLHQHSPRALEEHSGSFSVVVSSLSSPSPFASIARRGDHRFLNPGSSSDDQGQKPDSSLRDEKNRRFHNNMCSVASCSLFTGYVSGLVSGILIHSLFGNIFNHPD